MPVLSHLHHLFNADQCQASIHTLRWKDHIPTDLVVAQEASDVESSSRRDFLLLHNLRKRFVA
jgi:hypothetical protein